MGIESAVILAFALGIASTRISSHFLSQYGKWLRKAFGISLEFSLGFAFVAVSSLALCVAHNDVPRSVLQEAGIILSSILLVLQATSALIFWWTRYDK